MKRVRAGAVLLTFLVGALGWAPSTEAATSMSISWSLPGGLYAVGIDHVRTDGSSAAGYEQFYEYPYSLYNNSPVLPKPVTVSSATTLSQVRMEFYARHPGANYDALSGDGAVALRVPPSPSVQNIGMVQFPAYGAANGAKLYGNVLSRTAIGQGRVRLEIFQTTGQPISSTGYAMDAFSATNSVGSAYQSGPLWNGEYIAFVTDTATNRLAVGLLNLSGDSRLDLDLDITCFGIDECQWTGSTPTAPGRFHAVAPARLVDTRLGLGVPGVLVPGDGRNSDPNPVHRMNSRLGHEFVVAGRGGVPLAGVSAVLLNVTVTQGTSSGALRLIPKPPRSSVFQDQSSYPASNNQGLAVNWTPNETRASLQLVNVGVGGRVRVDSSSFGNVHLVVDVVGWVDQSQPNQGGSRLLTVTPSRLLDTRDGTGGPMAPFGPTETRSLQMTGRAGIPAGAQAVIGNLTGTGATGRTWQLAWPDGSPRPTASVLNMDVATVRPNLVTTGVSAGGAWSLYNNAASTHLVFDAVGYFTSAAGSTGLITAVPSARLLAPTPLASGQELALQMAGRGGVPPTGAKAVFVLLSSTNSSAGGWLNAYPNGLTRPLSSNLNWKAGQAVANLALVPVAADGYIRLYAQSSAMFTVDVLGWVN